MCPAQNLLQFVLEHVEDKNVEPLVEVTKLLLTSLLHLQLFFSFSFFFVSKLFA